MKRCAAAGIGINIGGNPARVHLKSVDAAAYRPIGAEIPGRAARELDNRVETVLAFRIKAINVARDSFHLTAAEPAERVHCMDGIARQHVDDAFVVKRAGTVFVEGGHALNNLSVRLHFRLHLLQKRDKTAVEPYHRFAAVLFGGARHFLRLMERYAGRFLNKDMVSLREAVDNERKQVLRRHEDIDSVRARFL